MGGHLGEPRVEGQPAALRRSEQLPCRKRSRRGVESAAAPRHSRCGVGRRVVLQTAHKFGLGAFVLLMGASLLAMRPQSAAEHRAENRRART